MKPVLYLAISCVVAFLSHNVCAQPTVLLDNFATVVAKKQPTSGGDYVTWYDSLNKNASTPLAAAAPGGMIIQGQDTINGVYRIFQSAVPSTGSWHINCKIQIFEPGLDLDVIRKFQVGVAVNGAHRGLGNAKLAPVSIFAENPSWYLTAGNDTPRGEVLIRTPDFAANSGDSILVSLGTDVTSGNYNLNSGAWGTSYVIIKELVLEQQGLPVSLSGFTVE